MEINKEFLGKLFEQAVENPRLRQSYDLRTSSDDNSQRILNALLPGTVVPIHRHPNSNENVLLLCGKLVEVIYDENGKEKERIHLDPTIGNYGCVIPPGAWHTVEILEPSVIYEAKDGKYGEDVFYSPFGYSGDMHPLIPVKCTHLLNYQFDKVILFFLNCLLLTRFYALCELPCL